jgi:hypothetical protein
MESVHAPSTESEQLVIERKDLDAEGCYRGSCRMAERTGPVVIAPSLGRVIFLDRVAVSGDVTIGPGTSVLSRRDFGVHGNLTTSAPLAVEGALDVSGDLRAEKGVWAKGFDGDLRVGGSCYAGIEGIRARTISVGGNLQADGDVVALRPHNVFEATSPEIDGIEVGGRLVANRVESWGAVKCAGVSSPEVRSFMRKEQAFGGGELGDRCTHFLKASDGATARHARDLCLAQLAGATPAMSS